MTRTAADLRAENARLRAALGTVRALCEAQAEADLRYPDVEPVRTVPITELLDMLAASART